MYLGSSLVDSPLQKCLVCIPLESCFIRINDRSDLLERLFLSLVKDMLYSTVNETIYDICSPLVSI